VLGALSLQALSLDAWKRSTVAQLVGSVHEPPAERALDPVGVRARFIREARPALFPVAFPETVCSPGETVRVCMRPIRPWRVREFLLVENLGFVVCSLRVSGSILFDTPFSAAVFEWARVRADAELRPSVMAEIEVKNVGPLASTVKALFLCVRAESEGVLT
jgi:hypothetical protein